MRYALSDIEWKIIRPILPSKPRGVRETSQRDQAAPQHPLPKRTLRRTHAPCSATGALIQSAS